MATKQYIKNSNALKTMPISAYIWALWHTKTGKVFICLFIAYLVIGMLIDLLGWWLLPIVALFVVLLLILDYRKRKSYERSVKEMKLQREKEHREALKRLKNNLDAFMQKHPMAIGNTKFNEHKCLYKLYWLVFEYPEGRKMEVYQNEFFNLRFGIAPDYDGIVINIKNISNNDIIVDLASAKVFGDNVYIDNVKHSEYKSGDVLRKEESISKVLSPIYWHDLGRKEKMFDKRNMDIFDVNYHVQLKIYINGVSRHFNYKIISQKVLIE